jgi:hypothetical protein
MEPTADTDARRAAAIPMLLCVSRDSVSALEVLWRTTTIRQVVNGNSGWVAAISSAKDGFVSEGSA